jgi:hypothetical protein
MWVTIRESAKGAPAAPWFRGRRRGPSRGKLGRNKATILTARLLPRDGDHTR